MRFDDTLETVLAADLSSPSGAQSAWRQLIDLIGRRRAVADVRAMATLRRIRDAVPPAVRVASARALEYANPPAQLVRLLALDSLSVGAPVLRSARLTASEWIELLPDLTPGARAVLRGRRDLPPVVTRALESYGPVDFVLPDGRAPEAVAGAVPAAEAEAAAVAAPVGAGAAVDADADAGDGAADEAVLAPRFLTRVPVDADARGDAIPGAPFLQPQPAVVAPPPAAPRDAAEVTDSARETVAPAPRPAHDGAMQQCVAENPGSAPVRPAIDDDGPGPFEIAEVVARIDAFWREREAGGRGPATLPPADLFRFETDANGVIRWVEGVTRGAVIGLALDQRGAGAAVDGVAAGAFRRRTSFANARLHITGESDAAGDWLLSGVPAFDPASGRFTGYRGTARRPRADERAEPSRAGGSPAESLRQLVHELRTPTNAIAGFAEMIEAQMLGPVPEPYRERAQVIRTQARELLGAIDDLDLAARIDSATLALVPGQVALAPLLATIGEDLAPLAALRGSSLVLPPAAPGVQGDHRAVERLLTRLLATLVSATRPGERIGVRIAAEPGARVAITIDRPHALADYPGDAVLGIDDEREDSSLLGTGFALRLARNLARELGGALAIEATCLTLRLPAAETGAMDQVHRS